MPGLNSLTLSAQPAKGRPSLISLELIEELATALSEIPYAKPACESVGIAYETLRQWIAKGDADKREGRGDSLYSHLIDRLARARAQTERRLAKNLADSDDWRAGAFYLERGFRERWDKQPETTQASIVLQVPEALASVLADALRVASATIVIPSSEIEQSSAPLAIEAEPAPPAEPSEPSPAPELEQPPDRITTTVKARRR